MQTDALSITWNDHRIFAAEATIFHSRGALVLKSDIPVTFEYSEEGIKYYRNTAGEIMIGSVDKPSSVILNGVSIKNFLVR